MKMMINTFLLISDSLDRSGKNVKKFNNNFPGKTGFHQRYPQSVKDKILRKYKKVSVRSSKVTTY